MTLALFSCTLCGVVYTWQLARCRVCDGEGTVEFWLFIEGQEEE